MTVKIPFNRDFKCRYGVIEQVSPLIRRIVADNPGPFTFTGTGTYIVGHGEVAVIDPGPAIDQHVEALLRGLDGETVSHIAVTHTHPDHSPASAALKQATGAQTYGFGPHGAAETGGEEGADRDFVPDVALRDGDVISGEGWSLEAVHTPGHTSNHLCFALAAERTLFSGDHVMGWSTTVISPPDGDMADYMASLRKLLDRDDAVYWPTHGPAIIDPKPYVEAFIAHREERVAEIMSCIADGVGSIPGMVAVMYRDVPGHLHPAAARSVLAHLVYMVDKGSIVCDQSPAIEARFELP